MSALNIPTLETDRLILRAPREEDVRAELDFYASDASRFVGGPMRPDQVWRQQATIMGHWLFRGYGYWAAVAKDTGAYLGRIGLWFPEGWPEREIGWTLLPAAQGNGYATEGGAALRQYAYETLGWDTAISLIAPENAASQAVARRLGARFETHLDHPRFGTVEIWRHIAPDAQLAQGVA
ncbi:MAG: GNAT family N-acetyltransferase [Thalassovita sp.]